jgi:glycine cleavage system H protein
MIEIRGYRFPSGLLYDVAHHCWYRQEADGTVVLGMTEVATTLSGPILAYTPKRVGLALEAGRSCAVIESGKWVGPVRAAFAGVVVAVNEALMADPGLATREPSGGGWIIRARPDAMGALGDLVSGNGVEAAYGAWMEAEDFPAREG